MTNGTEAWKKLDIVVQVINKGKIIGIFLQLRTE